MLHKEDPIREQFSPVPAVQVFDAAIRLNSLDVVELAHPIIHAILLTLEFDELIIEAPSTVLFTVELVVAAIKLAVVLTKIVPVLASDTGPPIASKIKSVSV